MMQSISPATFSPIDLVGGKDLEKVIMIVHNSPLVKAQAAAQLLTSAKSMCINEFKSYLCVADFFHFF